MRVFVSRELRMCVSGELRTIRTPRSEFASSLRRCVVVVASQKTPNTGQNRIVRVSVRPSQKTQTGTLAI